MLGPETNNEAGREQCSDCNRIFQIALSRNIQLSNLEDKHKKVVILNWVLSALLIFIFMFSAYNANASSCSYARLSWEPPATRVNGNPLTIDKLSIYEVVGKDMATGEEYIVDRFGVKFKGNVAKKRLYTTEANQNMPLRVGEQCFKIRVSDTEDQWSEFSNEACKVMCGFERIDLDIRISIGNDDE